MLKDFASKYRKVMDKWKNFQHDDMHDGNIMIDEKNNLRLIDFGLSSFEKTQSIEGRATSCGIDIDTLIDKTDIDIWKFPRADLNITATIHINGMSYKIYLNDELRTFINQMINTILRYSSDSKSVLQSLMNEHRDFINEYPLTKYNTYGIAHILRANPDAVIAGLLKAFTNT